jgi:hypothetical protein
MVPKIEARVCVADGWLFRILAAVDAWHSNFEGDAADVLLATISSYLHSQRNVYARHTCIINPFGTGKSRMVDELSRINTVPMCFREDGTKGLISVALFLAYL